MPGDPFYSTPEWRKLRAKVRTKWVRDQRPCPWCGKPIQRGEKTIVDHHLPRKDRPDLALVEANLVLLHHVCHSRKTQHVDYNDKTAVGLDGFPEDGEWGR